MQKTTFGYLNPILGKFGVMHDFHWWLVGKPMVDFLFGLAELFCYLLRFWNYEAKCVQLGCFRRALTSLQSNLTWTWSFPILDIRKLETLCYPRVKIASLCIPSFWCNPGVWRTDGWICHSVYSACKASFAVRYKILCIYEILTDLVLVQRLYKHLVCGACTVD